jgi:hypothetical protein
MCASIGSGGRWLTAVTWLAILTPIPYGVSRLLWAAGVPAGIDEHLLRESDRVVVLGSGRGVLGLGRGAHGRSVGVLARRAVDVG